MSKNVSTKESRKRVARKHKPSKEKVAVVISEFKHGTLHSGKSKSAVTNPKQAIAIGLSEARKSGAKIPKPKKK